MAIFYQEIIKGVALRAVQIAGGNAAARKAAYAAASIENYLDGIELPWGALKDDILRVEQELAEAIGSSTNMFFRRHLEARSANIASGSILPLVSQSGDTFFGAPDGVFDGTDHRPLTEQPIRVIAARNTNPGGFFKVPSYIYSIEGTVIHHCRSTVYLRGCAWNRSSQAIKYDLAADTPSNAAFISSDVDTTNDMINETAHKFFTGMRLRFTTTGTLPAPLQANTDYWAIAADLNNFKVALSLNDATFGNAVDLTTGGSGNHTAVIQGHAGGGESPLPGALAGLWMYMVLEGLPQEGWFVNEAAYYSNLVREKKADVIAGRAELLAQPAMPLNTSRVDPAKGEFL